MKKQPPNLFEYATSELSQDAFICWLAAWADPGFKELDEPLNDVAVTFVVRLNEIGKGKPITSIHSVDPCWMPILAVNLGPGSWFNRIWCDSVDGLINVAWKGRFGPAKWAFIKTLVGRS